MLLAKHRVAKVARTQNTVSTLLDESSNMHANNIKIRETGRILTQDDRTYKGGSNDLKQEFYEI